MKYSENYDGNFIEFTTSYSHGYDVSFLTNPNENFRITNNNWIAASCALDKKSCDQIFNLLQAYSQEDKKIIVNGRYQHSFKNHNNWDHLDGSHIIEITEINPVK